MPDTWPIIQYRLCVYFSLNGKGNNYNDAFARPNIVRFAPPAKSKDRF